MTNQSQRQNSCGRTRVVTAVLVSVGIFLVAAPATSRAAIESESVFPSLPQLVWPIALVQAPGDTSQWYAAERDGRVLRFENSPTVSTLSTFIDIRGPGGPVDVESSLGESGMLGIAFHPDYATNGQVFLSYTVVGAPVTSRVSRFTTTDGGLTLDPNSEDVVISLPQPHPNHNGGNIAFGPDGYLYIGFGDGGFVGDPGDRAQNTSNLFGSMLRIDVDGGTPYAIPESNPNFGNDLCNTGSGEAPCPEIYAWGFRNPWRWSFDSATGDLWVGDVGQDTYEEVDIVELGGNYGWRCREGAHDYNTTGICPEDLIDPVIEYDHTVGDSITGGYVYRGAAAPSLTGRYIFADFVQRKIFASTTDGQGNYGYEFLLDIGFGSPSFAQDENGEILYLVVASNKNIRRIIQTPEPPGPSQPQCSAAPLPVVCSSPDLNANDQPDVVAALPGSVNVHVRDGETDATINDIAFGSDPGIAVEMINDLNGNGAPEVAVLSLRPSGQVVVTVRDSLTDAIINTIFYGSAYSPLDMAILPDSNGNNAPEFVVLGVHAGGGIRAQARDALTNVATSTTYYGANATAIDVQVLPDINGNGAPEIAMHARVNASNQGQVQFRDSMTGALIRQVFFGTAYVPIQIAVIDDITGDGIPELAQLARRDDTGAVRIQVKNPADGATVSNAFAGNTDRPVDIVGTGGVVGILVEDTVGRARVIKRDASTGAFIGNIFMGAIGVPEALVVLDDLNGSGDPEFAALGDNAGQRVIQIRDSVSGAQINNVSVP